MKHPRPYQLRIAPNRLWLHNSQGGSWRSHLLRIFLIQRHLLRVMLRCFTGQATSLKHRDAEISWRHVYHVFTIYLSYIYHISIYIYHHISTIGLDDWIERPPWSSSKSGRWASAHPLTAGWRAHVEKSWGLTNVQYISIPYIIIYTQTPRPTIHSQWVSDLWDT